MYFIVTHASGAKMLEFLMLPLILLPAILSVGKAASP